MLVGFLAGIAAAERRAVRRMIQQIVILEMIGAGGAVYFSSRGKIYSMRGRVRVWAAERRNLAMSRSCGLCFLAVIGAAGRRMVRCMFLRHMDQTGERNVLSLAIYDWNSAEKYLYQEPIDAGVCDVWFSLCLCPDS